MLFFTDKVESKGLTFDPIMLMPYYSEDSSCYFEPSIWVTPIWRTNKRVVMEAAKGHESGISVIDENKSIVEQVKKDTHLKRAEKKMISDPVFFSVEKMIREVKRLMKTHEIGVFSLINACSCRVGIFANRDYQLGYNLIPTI